MYDTFVTAVDTTPCDDVILGKNSDRTQGDIQDLINDPSSNLF